MDKWEVAARMLELLFLAHLAIVAGLMVALCLVLWWLGIPAPPWWIG